MTIRLLTLVGPYALLEVPKIIPVQKKMAWLQFRSNSEEIPWTVNSAIRFFLIGSERRASECARPVTLSLQRVSNSCWL